MDDILIRIKRAIIAGRYEFSAKAILEMDAEGIDESDVVESIVNAVAIYKTLRSTSAFRSQLREDLYVIMSPNMNGLPVYTKGKLVKKEGIDVYYFLISSKVAVR